MRRQEGGIGCGARGRGSYPRTREALASRPPALRPAAFNGWTWRGRRAAEAARIRGREGRFRPAPGSTAPGTEKPLVARREAPARSRKDRELSGLRFSARHPLRGRFPRVEPEGKL